MNFALLSVSLLSIIHFRLGFEVEKEYILPVNIVALAASLGVVGDVSRSCLFNTVMSFAYCAEVKDTTL